jgi:hypothetical protein
MKERNFIRHFARLGCLLSLCLLMGCRSQYTSVEYERQVLVSLNHPDCDNIGAKIIRIDQDGSVIIQPYGTNKPIRAAVGGYFVSEEYGRNGLQVLSSNPLKREAVLMQRGADDH